MWTMTSISWALGCLTRSVAGPAARNSIAAGWLVRRGTRRHATPRAGQVAVQAIQSVAGLPGCCCRALGLGLQSRVRGPGPCFIAASYLWRLPTHCSSLPLPLTAPAPAPSPRQPPPHPPPPRIREWKGGAGAGKDRKGRHFAPSSSLLFLNYERSAMYGTGLASIHL